MPAPRRQEVGGFSPVRTSADVHASLQLSATTGSGPPPNPTSCRQAMTRWHGTMIGTGLRLQARPTAWAPPGSPTARAIAPCRLPVWNGGDGGHTARRTAATAETYGTSNSAGEVLRQLLPSPRAGDASAAPSATDPRSPRPATRSSAARTRRRTARRRRRGQDRRWAKAPVSGHARCAGPRRNRAVWTHAPTWRGGIDGVDREFVEFAAAAPAPSRDWPNGASRQVTRGWHSSATLGAPA
jgi:hypothetical protein